MTFQQIVQQERVKLDRDAQLFFNTGNYLMDQAAFFRKWMRDMADLSENNGMIYNIKSIESWSQGIYGMVICMRRVISDAFDDSIFLLEKDMEMIC